MFNFIRNVFFGWVCMTLVSAAFAKPPVQELEAFIERVVQLEHVTATEKKQLDDIVFVVFCEDNTNLERAKMVLSTIYNRAKSHEIRDLHREVSRKRQYSCFSMKRIPKKLDNQRYRDIYQMVKDFIRLEQAPSTSAKFFYNHKLVQRSALGKMRLKVVAVSGSHTYLDNVDS